MTTLVKRGDTHQVRWRVFERGTKVPMDLTGATVEVHVRPTKPKGAAAITLAATALPPETDGVVGHDLTGTLLVGEYDLQIEVTIAGDIQTVPTEGSDLLIVEEDLA